MAQSQGHKSMAGALGLLRPWQWVKNAFVLAPLLFSGEYSHAGQVGRALVAFAAFCGLASAIYALNDIADCK